MEQKIIGRKAEQETLKNCYESGKPEFVAVTPFYVEHLVRRRELFWSLQADK